MTAAYIFSKRSVLRITVALILSPNAIFVAYLLYSKDVLVSKLQTHPHDIKINNQVSTFFFFSCEFAGTSYSHGFALFVYTSICVCVKVA